MRRVQGVRRASLALLVLVTAVLVSPAVPAGAVDAFRVRGSLGQLESWGHAPGTTVSLHDAGGALLAEEPADAQGAVLFEGLDPGPGYVVEAGGQSADPVDVLDPDVPPAPETYQGIPVADGYGYLPTRDGTLLSINVKLPAGPGPWPTLVTYSGYDPANPAGLPAEVLAYTLLGLRGGRRQHARHRLLGRRLRLLRAGPDAPTATTSSRPSPTSRGPTAGSAWSASPTPASASSSWPPPSRRTSPPSPPLSPLRRHLPGDPVPRAASSTRASPCSWAARARRRRPSPRPGQWAQDLIAAGDTTCADNQVMRLQSQDLDAEIRPDRFDDPERRYLDTTSLASTRSRCPPTCRPSSRTSRPAAARSPLRDQLQVATSPSRRCSPTAPTSSPSGPRRSGGSSSSSTSTWPDGCPTRRCSTPSCPPS